VIGRAGWPHGNQGADDVHLCPISWARIMSPSITLISQPPSWDRMSRGKLVRHALKRRLTGSLVGRQVLARSKQKRGVFMDSGHPRPSGTVRFARWPPHGECARKSQTRRLHSGRVPSFSFTIQDLALLLGNFVNRDPPNIRCQNLRVRCRMAAFSRAVTKIGLSQKFSTRLPLDDRPL